MPATGHRIRKCRPTHERGVVAMPPTDLLHGAAEQRHVIRRLEARSGAKHKLHLARAELQFHGCQFQAEREHIPPQDIDDRLHAIEPLLGEMLVAVMREFNFRRRARLPTIFERELRIDQAGDMELDFEPGHERLAARQSFQHPLEQVAGGEGHWRAVGMIQIAEHPSRRRKPRQHAEGRGIRHHDDVAAALQLRAAQPSAWREHRHYGAMRCVFQQQRRSNRATITHGARHGCGKQRLATQDAVQVRK